MEKTAAKVTTYVAGKVKSTVGVFTGLFRPNIVVLEYSEVMIDNSLVCPGRAVAGVVPPSGAGKGFGIHQGDHWRARRASRAADHHSGRPAHVAGLRAGLHLPQPPLWCDHIIVSHGHWSRRDCKYCIMPFYATSPHLLRAARCKDMVFRIAHYRPKSASLLLR